MQDNSNNSSASKPSRNGLRLVQSKTDAATQTEAEAQPAEAPRRKSALVQFMNAYADSIDRDIKLLLDL